MSSKHVSNQSGTSISKHFYLNIISLHVRCAGTHFIIHFKNTLLYLIEIFNFHKFRIIFSLL